MTPVPKLDKASVVFGNIAHMPHYADLPEEYQRGWHYDSLKPCKFVSDWFYKGLKDADIPPVREGVDRAAALAALSAILRSWEPKHEHKIAGAGFLANEWFDFSALKQAAE